MNRGTSSSTSGERQEVAKKGNKAIGNIKKQNKTTVTKCMNYFECFTVTVSTIYCLRPKLRLFFLTKLGIAVHL